jgi:outer membrane protein TolC
MIAQSIIALSAMRSLQPIGLQPRALILTTLLCWTVPAALGGQVWTLPEAIEYALEHSPDTRVAEHQITAARAVLDQAKSTYWPQLRLGSSYVRTDNPMQVFGAAINQESLSPGLDYNHVPDADNFNVHGLVVLPLYAGGRNAAGRQAARANATAARHASDSIRNQLAFEVARTFYTIHKAQAFIRATQAAVDAFESHLAIARKRFQSGTALKPDVLDVEVRLAQAREDLVQARNAHALALRALHTLLGLEGEPIAISDELPALELPPTESLPQRAELLAAQQQTAAAEAATKRARGGFWPQVDAFGRYDYDHGWKFDGSGDSYTVGLQARWDLWDGQRTRARVSEARAQLEAAREAERKLRLAIELELEQARIKLKEATERLAVTETVVARARESAALTRSRFEQGLALATQLIDAETALTVARVRRAEAESDHQIAVAALRKALGLSPITLPSKPA